MFFLSPAFFFVLSPSVSYLFTCPSFHFHTQLSSCEPPFPLSHPKTSLSLFYISKYDSVSIYHIPHCLISLSFLCSSFSLLTMTISLPDPVMFFVPPFSPLPIFHLWPASTNEHCHGSIDTGWSVCSQHREQNECACHASFHLTL